MKLLVHHEEGGKPTSEVVQAQKNERGRWTGSRQDGTSAIADTPNELADALGSEPRMKRLVEDEQLGRVYR